MTVLNAAALAALAVDAYDTGSEPIHGLPPGFVRLGVAGATAPDVSGAAYFNAATGELVVAYAGADSLRSLFTNLSFVASTSSESELNQALSFLDGARAAVASGFGVVVSDAAITLTGHGVGGGFASLVSLATGAAAVTFNGTRIGALVSAMEERFGALTPAYADRIVNYVLAGEEASTLPRGTAQVGRNVDVAASDLTFFGQLSTALGTPTLGSAVLHSVYDWLSADGGERQRAQRTLMALELQFGAVATAGPTDAAHEQVLTDQLNKLIQTDYADVVRTRSFDRLMLDGSDGGRTQDASAYAGSNDLIIGADGADALFGGAGSDVLFGGDGNDLLNGGAGADLLFGGAGSDLYAFAAGAGDDSIRDDQGVNRLSIDGRAVGGAYFQQADGTWQSADGRVSVEAQAGRLLVQGAGVRVGLEGFADAQFGIQRFAARGGLSATPLLGDQDPESFEDILSGGALNDTILAGAGADFVGGGGGADVLFGGSGSDVLAGGAGNDWLYGDGDTKLPDAIVQAGTGVAAQGEWLAGNEGDDVLLGGALDDVLTGGGGRDTLIGGAGRDFLFGDADYVANDIVWSVVARSDGRTNYYSANAAVNDPATSGADVIYAGAGNDWVSAGRGDDHVYGGDGDDHIQGNAGADTLYGEAGRDELYAADRTVSIDRSDDYLDGGDGDDRMFASDGNNLLFGGSGNDVISGGAGEDYIDAGDGNDTVTAQGADVVYGGRGNDRISGFSTAAMFFDGGDGDDVLSADLGDDTLRGGDGADTLIGNEGADTLDGGGGNDIYRFAVGDGVDTVADEGGSDTLEFVSTSADTASHLTRDQIRLVADASDLWLVYGTGGDKVHLGADPLDMIENVALRTVNGAAESVESWALSSMRVSLDGTASSEALFAVAGFSNALTAGGGRDLLFGSELADVLDGGAGDDLLKGGDGADRYLVGLGGGIDTVNDDGLQGSDSIEFSVAADVAKLGLSGSALFIDLGAGAGVKVVGFDADNAASSVNIERFQFVDRALDVPALLARGFDILGGTGSQTLSGTSVSDRFFARSGNEKLQGGRGNDTYTFERGFGRDQIVDQDATAGNFDRVVFTDIDSTDVVTSATADRLTLTVRGTNDQLEIQWVPTAGAQIESIQFADATWDLATLQGLFRPANAEPGLANPIIDQSVREDTAFAFALPAGTFRDPDNGDTLTLTATLDGGGALPSWLTFDGAVFRGTPQNGDVGVLGVRVVARDSSGATVADVFEIAVQNVNDAPTVAAQLAAQEVFEDEAFSFRIPAGTFIDVDAGDTLRYVATLEKGARLPAWLAFDEATGTFSGTPGNADVGTLAVHVVAVDGAGELARDVFELQVVNENDAPEVAAPLADARGREGHAVEIGIPDGTFIDIDRGDSLTLVATLANGAALPPWLVYDAEAGLLRGAPLRADIGSYTVRLTATDSAGASVYDDFVVTIDAVPGMVLTGTSGNDVLNGDAGDDTLAGRAGQDILDGGGGDDSFSFFRDAVWLDGARRTNLGSPDGSGTGESASIGRRARSYDVFIGGTGVDTLQGTGSADAILLDDVLSPPAGAGARIQSIEVILAGSGDDVVDLTSTSYSLGNVRVEGGAGSDVIWSSGGDDILLGGTGADRIFGGAGNDFLSGGGGGDDLNGGLGLDIIQGDNANDRLFDVSGANVLDGRNGADDLLDGSGSAFLTGGRGNDRITLGGGNDVVAFNRGDGRDILRGQSAATLSLGGGIALGDLALRKSGADLVVELGQGERVTMQEWYAAPANQSVLNLQVITEVMQGYNPASTNPLLNSKVQQFDFGGIVEAFDTARAAQPTMSRWLMMNALLDEHLGGTDAAALGGDLAYQYGRNGSLSGMGLTAAQEVIGQASFGSASQGLRAGDVLAAGPIKLG